MKLTDRHAYTAKCPAGLNQADLRDDQVRGLFLRVYKSGVKTWGVFYRRRQDNRRRWLKLGAYPGLSLKQARDLAEIELGKVACGADPQSAREEVRTRPGTETFADRSPPHLVGRDWEVVDRRFEDLGAIAHQGGDRGHGPRRRAASARAAPACRGGTTPRCQQRH